MAIMDSYYQVKCTIWNVTTDSDMFGNPIQTVSSPIHVWCGVEYGERQTRDEKGEELHSDTQVLLADKYSIDCWIYIGEWIDGAEIHADARRPVSVKAKRLVVGNEILGWWYAL